jgi:4-amino-4-deoxy-L-arabinose transferase-like glycosyltransferase
MPGWLGPVVAVVLAGVLRIPALDRSELWFDEAYSALVAPLPLAQLLDELGRDSSPPLYYLTLHFWMGIVGGEPAALRALSVIAGLLAVYLCYVLGRLLWDETAGRRAALLLALSPLHVYYSREVRPYSFFVVLVLVSLIALHRLTRSERPYAASAAYTLATLGAAYTHNYGVLLLAALPIAALGGNLSPKKALVSGALVLGGYLLWIPVLLEQMQSGATAWVERWWIETPPAAALFKSLAAFCIGGHVPTYVPLGAAWVPGPTAWIAYAVFAFLAGRALLQDGEGSARRVALTLGALLAIPWVLSFWRPLYLVGRHDVLALPLFLLLAARGSLGLGRLAFSGTLVFVLGLAALSLAGYYTVPPLDGVRSQAETLTRLSGENDRVLCTGFTRNQLEYYVRLKGGRQEFSSFPTSFGLHRGWLDERELGEPAAIAADTRNLVGRLQRDLVSGGRLWIAHSRLLQEANEVLMAEIQSNLRQVGCPGGAESMGFTCWRAAPSQGTPR